MELVFLPQQYSDERRLGAILNKELSDQKWTYFSAAVAFSKKSGIQHIYGSLKRFASNKNVKIITGIDLDGTSIEGIQLLLEALDGKGQLWVYHNENGSTFHPKIYLFYNDNEATVIIGSQNFTQGGMYTNYEASVQINLSLENQVEADLLQEILETIENWSNNAKDLAQLVDENLLKVLIDNGYIIPEKFSYESRPRISKREGGVQERMKLFPSQKVNLPPKIDLPPIDLPEYIKDEDYIIEQPEIVESQNGLHRIFLMTLQKTDVGVGQTTTGASRRSPEVFIPLSARNADMEFWGWNAMFVEDPDTPKKYDRKDVRMRLGGEVISVNMMTWPAKSDFRLRSEALRSAGNVGDILKIETSSGEFGYQYRIEIVPQDSPEYPDYKRLCINQVGGNSVKEWGYLN